MSKIEKDLGASSAYAYAVQYGGYTGTEEEYGQEMADLANISAEAETLSPDEEASASYSGGVLSFGVPQGVTGNGIASAVLNSDFTLTLTFTDGTTYTTPTPIRGETGAKGDTGETGATGATGNGIASIAKTGTSGLVDTYTITFTDSTTTTFDVTNGTAAIDNTLSIAGRAADAKAVGDALGTPICREIIPDSPGYLKTNVSPVDVSNPGQSSTMFYKIVPCQAGDQFVAYGRYIGSVADLYTFVDANYNVLERSIKVDEDKKYYPVAPENSAYIIVQKSGVRQNQFWENISVQETLSNVKNSVSALDALITGIAQKILPFSQNLTGWENTGIVSSTGVITKNTRRLLTNVPYTAKSCYVDEGYSYLIFAWDGDTYLGWWNGSAWSKENMVSRSTELDLTPFSEYDLTVVLIHGTTVSSAQYISADEGVHFWIKADTDSLLNTKNTPADGFAVGEAINASESSILETVKTITGNTKINLTNIGYLNTNGATVDISSPLYEIGFTYEVYPCVQGDVFTVKGASPGAVAGYCVFIDSSYNVISREGSHTDYTVIEAPTDSAYVILQNSTVYNNEFYTGSLLIKDVSTLKVNVDDLSQKLNGYNSPAYYTADDNQALITTYAALIGMYDALATANPDYITKNALTSGTFTNYEYVFSMGNRNGKSGNRNQDAESAKPKILLMAGVHGYERCSIMGLYLFAKGLCENAQLSALREGLIIKMIPVVCPSGYDNNTRVNSNGVNINRNFDANWVLTPEGNDYSGAAPADQDETKVVQAWLDANTDAVIAIDWHNSAYVNEVSYLATCVADGFAVNAKKGFFCGIDHITGHWMLDRGIADADVIYGYTGVDNAGGRSYAYMKKVGLNGCLFETSWNVGDYGKDSNASIGVNVEAFSAAIKGIYDKLIDV